MLGGVIFDWDGVVVDSSFAHEKSWEILADEENLSLPGNHFESWFGVKSDEIIKKHLKWSDNNLEIRRLNQRKEELYQQIVRETGLEPLPGVKDFLSSLKDAGVKTVVGTSTPRANLELAFDLLGLAEYFDEAVTATDVVHGKPDPEVFLKAAQAIGCEPKYCVVLEDAPVGIKAGLTAGTYVIGLATTRSATEISAAHKVINDLSDLTLEEIEPILKGHFEYNNLSII